jgi:uncharacterized protein
MANAGRIYDWLMSHRAIALLFLVVTTAALCAGFGRFRFDNSYRIWFVDGDPALVAYDDFLDRFGSDELLVLGLATEGDALSNETLAIVRALSDRLADHEEVRFVGSLTSIEALHNPGGALEPRRLVEEIPPDDAQRAFAAEMIDASPIYRGLVSDDGAWTAILLTLELTGDSFEPKAELVRHLRVLVDQLAPDRAVALAGPAVLDEAFYAHSARDTRTYGPITIAVLILVLALLFRSVPGVLLPLGVVAMSLVWAFGLLCWMGWVANVVTTIVSPLLLAIGVADSIHLLQHLRLASRQGLSPDEALREAFCRVLRPCLLTTLTTAAGMASFSVASLVGIRQFGLTAAFGVLAAFLFTMVGLPLALSVLPARWLGGLTGAGRPPVPGFLVSVARTATRRRIPVLVGSLIFIAVAIAGIAQLRIGTAMNSYLWSDDPVYQESVTIDTAFGGSLPIEVLVEARGDGDLLDPETLARIVTIGEHLASQPATGDAITAVDFLLEARRVLRAEPPGSLELPATRAEAAQVLLLAEGAADIGRFLSADYATTRIEVPIRMDSYQQLLDRLDEVDLELQGLAGDGADARITGLARLLGGMEAYLLQSQVRSLGLAFLLVLACITLFFRSGRAGLLSLVPNLFPLVGVLGLMGWLDIRLSMTTVMVAPLMLGLVVDDTVHVLERVVAARGEGRSVADAFTASVQEVGQAVLLTSVVLTAGLLVPALGSFRPNFHFAVLTAVAIVLALIGDLVVFPAVGCLVPGLVPRGRSRSD